MNGPRSFDDGVKDGTNVRSVERQTAQLNSKRGSNFFGDVGTTFNGPAREQIEEDKSSGAGHPGNDVDIAQRYAESEADEYTEQAERMTRTMERNQSFKHSGQFADPDKRREFVEGLAEQLRNPNGNGQKAAQPQEPAEDPSLSRTADDKFWSNPEEQQRVAKKVRPGKL